MENQKQIMKYEIFRRSPGDQEAGAPSLGRARADGCAGRQGVGTRAASRLASRREGVRERAGGGQAGKLDGGGGSLPNPRGEGRGLAPASA